MTRELAIECIKTQRQFVDDMTKEAINMAIEALRAQEVKHDEKVHQKQGETAEFVAKIGKTCTDAISRAAVVDMLDEIEAEVAEGYGFQYGKWRKWACELPPAQPEQDKEFIKLTVRNSNGRPYYSIIYLEFDDNGVGHDFEGYSSYSLDVISDYLKKYFMPSAQPDERWNRLMMYFADLQLTYSPGWGANGCGDQKLYDFVTELIERLEGWENDE